MSSVDYARELAAQPEWVWQPGMLMHVGDTMAIVVCVGGRLTAAIPQRLMHLDLDYPGLRPDIHQPATRGWLLEMLREAYGDQVEILTCRLDGTWCVCIDKLRLEYNAPTEGEALAAALLAVWGAS